MARGLRIGHTSDEYSLNFTTYGSNESPATIGGLVTNSVTGTGGNSALSLNQSMQIRLSDDTTTRILTSTGSTSDYDDSLLVWPGYSGNQRLEATVYRESGYLPTTTNHELLMGLGVVVTSGGNKRNLHFGFNAGTVGNTSTAGFFVAGFDGDLTSWDTVMGSPWSSGLTGLASGIADDGDVMRVELNRTAKTAKMWQNATLVVSLQWNDTSMVSSTAQAVLNALGDGVYLGGLRRPGADAIEGAFGWRDITISSTLLD